MTAAFRSGFISKCAELGYTEKQAFSLFGGLLGGVFSKKNNKEQGPDQYLEQDLDEYMSSLSKSELKKEKEYASMIFGDNPDPVFIRLSAMNSPKFSQFHMNKMLERKGYGDFKLSDKDIAGLNQLDFA